MPNWVYNTLRVINGDPQEVFAFVRSEESMFDFNTLVPQPEGLYHGSLGPKEFEKYGKNNWYNWNNANWGTKWNACDARYSKKDPEHVILFDTAWDAPAPVFAAMAKRFPGHEIVVYSDEYTNHFHTTFTLKDGQLTRTHETCEDCHCFEEDETPVTRAELDIFGIEEARD